MLNDSIRIFGCLFLSSAMAGCGGGGEGSTDDVIPPPILFDQTTREVFAGQDLSNFNDQIVPDVVAVVPSGSFAFEGTMSAIYGVDVDGNNGNQDVAIGDAVASFGFGTGVVTGSAGNFVLYSTETGCVEIPACDLMSVSTLNGAISITDGVAAGSAFSADLTGSLIGTGGFAVPDNTGIAGGFGQLEGAETMIVLGQSDFSAPANGAGNGVIRVLLVGTETD
jgi:hypothetical protein